MHHATARTAISVQHQHHHLRLFSSALVIASYSPQCLQPPSKRSTTTGTDSNTTTNPTARLRLQKRKYTTLQHQNHHHVAHVRSFLCSGPLPYEMGWAWQNVLLNRRLEYLRSIQQQQLKLQQQGNGHDLVVNANNNNHNRNIDNRDWILLFEHQPVYTLGRGASVDHLTFLSKSNHHNHHRGSTENDDDILKEEYRRRLCRTYRGKDASRLTSGNSSIQSNQCNDIMKTMMMSVDEEVNHHLRVLPKQQQQQQHLHSTVPPVLAPNGAPIYRIERGGEVTYHGPGQLVMYPMLHLKHPAYQQDLHWYLRQVEDVIIQTLDNFDIISHRDTINTGVWVGTNKIAAVGVSSSRWITSHGLALNVCPDLTYFGRDIITPCGIKAEGRGVTSIAEILKGRQNHNNIKSIDSQNDHVDNDIHCPTVEEVAEVALKCFEKVFGIDLKIDFRYR